MLLSTLPSCHEGSGDAMNPLSHLNYAGIILGIIGVKKNSRIMRE